MILALQTYQLSYKFKSENGQNFKTSCPYKYCVEYKQLAVCALDLSAGSLENSVEKISAVWVLCVETSSYLGVCEDIQIHSTAPVCL